MKSIIEIDRLSKIYRIGEKERRHDTLGGMVQDLALSPLNSFRKLRRLDTRNCTSNADDARVGENGLFWALSNLSITFQEGEVVGIVGRNGAGKSTLLKILSRITYPTAGKISIRGRMSSLLEVGTGFHPELSGRDNIYMNGTILGMTKKEIDKKFDAIIDFAGVEAFLDTPTKRYSSGMQVRLAFAVAAHLEPEILVIDEVLAVGDLQFQKKCLGKMKEVSQQGRTVLFVSHNNAAIKALCSQCILLEDGKLKQTGSPSDVLKGYVASTPSIEQVGKREDRQGSGRCKFEHVRIGVVGSNNDTSAIQTGNDLEIELIIRSEYESKQYPHLAVTITDEYDNPLTVMDNTIRGHELSLENGVNRIKLCIPRLPLNEGEYGIDLWIACQGERCDKVTRGITLQVDANDLYESGRTPHPRKHGKFSVPHSFAQTLDIPETSDPT